ncbi:MAG: response regulator [Candidatus Poseidonia sp.]|nr:response regulator [Poseidonia sp.]
MRVLAFEDHYDIEAMLVAGGLDLTGWTIEQRWNSSDALEHIRRFAPDVLLLDHYMPPMTGYEVLERLLNADINRPATIVAMSSDVKKNQAMLEAGADEAVVKFDLASLALWST